MTQRHARAARSSGLLFTQLTSLDNLRDRLDAATDEEHAEGLQWYLQAHDEAIRLSVRYGVSTNQAAGIIAALSPQLGWDINLRCADELLANDTAPGALGLGITRARQIRDTKRADPLEILGGPKVRSFYRNIAHPLLTGPVTIDRHAIAILHGSDTPSFLTRYPKALERYGFYRLAAGAYRTVASEYGLRPHEAQAIAWVSHRNADHLANEEF